jgi:anti-anti-sigma factor
MHIDLTTSAENLVIRLTGRFDFTTRQQFSVEIDSKLASTGSGDIRVEMGGVDYIDSSALGMLLMLRDKAKKLNRNVVLANASGSVSRALSSAQFERLFPIT